MRDEFEEGGPDPLVLRVAHELRSAPTGSQAADRALRILAGERSRTRRPWVMALAAGVALFLGTLLLLPRAPARRVRFALRAPASERVAVVGDFNDWNRDAAQLDHEDGEWSVTLRLRPGRYRYAFLVDGRRWVADQAAPGTDDDFGAPTSVITVPD